MNKIVSFIKNSRLKLNTIIIFSWLLKFILISGLISGFFIFIFRFFRLLNVDIFNWITFTIIGGFIGIIFGWYKRISILSTSKWLDDYLKSNDIFTSALICIDRKCICIYDKLIIDKANKILEKKIKISWPLKDIFSRLLYAVVSILFLILILGFWNPVFNKKEFVNLKSKTNLDIESNEEKKGNNGRIFDKELNSKDLSKLLFPENRELSELAEKAMARGDTEMLNELFEKEISKLDEMIKKAKNREEIDEIRKKQEQQKEAMQLIKNNENAYKEKENEENESVSMVSENENQEVENQSVDDDQQNNQEEDNDNKEAGIDTSEKGDGSISGIKQSDKGANNQKKKRDNIDGNNIKEKLLLTQKKDSLEFEFLLPEKDSRIPLKDVIVNSRRSAESAVVRKGVPIEYEDFVRSYFISLLQEMKKNLSNDEEEK